MSNINSVAENVLVVGISQGNPPPVTAKARGIIAPRTDYMHFKNIRLHNFPPTTTPLMSCNHCHSSMTWVTGGK